MKRHLLGLVSMLIAWGAHAAGHQDQGMQPCEPLDPSKTYHDLNDGADRDLLNTVQNHHFSKEVETLQQGQTAPLPKDIAFVLRWFPNHYRALSAMARWQLIHKLPLDDTGDERVWTAECYFMRALDFRPDDWKLHNIYGIYLHRAKRLAEAEREYAAAAENGAEGAEFFYNRGLLAIDMGQLDKASEYAEHAYALGAPLPGLRDRLARAHKEAAQGKQPISAAGQPINQR
jgi:Tfp pilus assembly protein PilF